MRDGLHGKSALEDVVHVETTVQEKNITYLTVSQTSDSALPTCNEESEGETRTEATQNHRRYFDAGAQHALSKKWSAPVWFHPCKVMAIGKYWSRPLRN